MGIEPTSAAWEAFLGLEQRSVHSTSQHQGCSGKRQRTIAILHFGDLPVLKPDVHQGVVGVAQPIGQSWPVLLYTSPSFAEWLPKAG